MGVDRETPDPWWAVGRAPLLAALKDFPGGLPKAWLLLAPPPLPLLAWLSHL